MNTNQESNQTSNKKRNGRTSFLCYLQTKWFLLFFCALCLGAVFSAKGASIESLQSVGITAEDTALASSSGGASVPELIGITPLSSEQNQFLNMRYALAGCLLGFPAGLLLLFLLYKLSPCNMHL